MFDKKGNALMSAVLATAGGLLVREGAKEVTPWALMLGFKGGVVSTVGGGALICVAAFMAGCAITQAVQDRQAAKAAK